MPLFVPPPRPWRPRRRSRKNPNEPPPLPEVQQGKGHSRFLPSESEWEYAAAGGGEQRAYPWGSTDPGADNLYAIYGCHYGAASSCKIAPVGIAPLGAGLWQQLDLAGELFEWTLDWYAPYVDPCSDCAYLAHGSYRVSRGGVFNTMASSLTPPYRGYFNTPWIRYGNVGVRCARTP